MVEEAQANARRELVDDPLAVIFAFLGFSLFRALMLDNYVSAFGTVSDNIGYVTNLPFMLGASGAIVVLSLGVALTSRAGYRPFTLPYRVPLVLIVAGSAASWLLLPSSAEVLAVLGIAWGAASTTLAISFSEIFACERNPLVVIMQLAFSSFFSATIVLGLGGSAGVTRVVAHVLLAACVLVSVRYCRSSFVPYTAEPAEQSQAGPARPEVSAVRSAFLPLLASFIFEMVVGFVNMFSWSGGSTFSITSQAPMWGMLVCAGLLVSIVALSNRVPNPDQVYLVAFPVAICVLLLLPILGDSMGGGLSVLIYAAYIFTSTLASYCYIAACASHRANFYVVSGLFQVLTRLFLLVGLGAGYAFAQMPDGAPALKTGIVVAVCIYLMVAATAVWGYRASSKRKVEVVVERVVELVPESFEEASRSRMESLADQYGLSARECDVYLQLVRGGTAKTIAEALTLSPYTVQGHIQSLYSKLCVNKKEQAIELFYRQE